MGRPPAKTERVPWLRDESIEAEAKFRFAWADAMLAASESSNEGGGT